MLVFVGQKMQLNQATPGESKQTGLSSMAVFARACRYVQILCTENAERSVFVAHISVCICTLVCVCPVCIHVCMCECARVAPGPFCLKVFPCVSNYYSVGGHTGQRGCL